MYERERDGTSYSSVGNGKSAREAKHLRFFASIRLLLLLLAVRYRITYSRLNVGCVCFNVKRPGIGENAVYIHT